MPSTGLLHRFSGSSEQRIQAVFHLLFDQSDKAIEIISNILFTDSSPIVRHEAAYILGEKNNVLAVKPLIQAIKTDSHKIVVHESALALANLGKLGHPESEQLIKILLKSNDTDIVDTAEIALQRLQMKLTNSQIIDEKSSLQEILFNSSSENKEKRIQASFLLMEDASSDSVELLIQALHSEPSAIVKHELIFSLGECIHYKVVPELIKVLETDSNFFTIHESLLALGTLGDTKAEPSIRKFLTSNNPEIAESAEIGLERLLS